MVTSDRLSAFDVVLDEPILHKGRVLTAISAFWFEALGDVAGSHLVSTDVADLPAGAADADPTWPDGSCCAARPRCSTIECIVRGYLSGSAWKEYKASGTMHGQALPAGLEESDQLPGAGVHAVDQERRATTRTSPSTRPSTWWAPSSPHGPATSRSSSTRAAPRWPGERGIIIADTKFELGLVDGELVLCDEVMTPDSSRFWPVDEWKPGITPPSFDKQPVRDYLDGLDWDKSPPPPPLPAEVVDADERALHRGLRADHRPRLLGLAGVA